MEAFGDDVTHLAKVVVLGDCGVGKTSILRRLVYRSFNKRIEASRGVEFYSKSFARSRGFKLQFWDVPTSSSHASRGIYYTGATIFIVVYSVSDADSFAHIKQRWLAEVDKSAFGCLVGNKSDLKHVRTVPEADAKSLAQENRLFYGGEISAYDGSGVEEAFNALVDAFDACDAAHRKAGHAGLTRLLDFPPTRDFEEESEDMVLLDGAPRGCWKKLKGWCI